MKLFLRLSYLGTNFCGYQVQGDIPTVQKALNEAAAKLFGKPCDITGCSRTDSGVHANDFCVTVSFKGSDSLTTALDPSRIPLALNAHLPEDIAVNNAKFVECDFHPRYDVVYKEYIYLIHNSRIRDPFMNQRAMHFPQMISEEGLRKMNEAAAHLCGTHDFSSYMAAGSNVATAVRTMKYVDVSKNGDLITVRMAADGFLYNMVRIITGTLLDVGVGRLSPDDVVRITESKDRTLAGYTVPACGLYLNKVVY